MQQFEWKKIVVKGILLIVVGLVVGQPLNAAIQPMTHCDQTRNQTDWWPMFRHDPNHSGTTTTNGPQTSRVLWTFGTGAEIRGSPTVVDNKVYIGSTDKKVYCLNLMTGEKLWEYETEGEVNSTPAVADGKVFVGSNDDKLYCLDAQTGTYLWNYTTGMAPVVSSPTVVNGRVYFGSQDHSFYCVNETTGSFIWSYYAIWDILSSPAVVGGIVYFGAGIDIWCVDATVGTHIWNSYTGGDISSSPSVADGKVFVGSDDGSLYCYDALNGGLQWSHQTGAAIKSSPAVTNGRVYVGSDDHAMYCLDESTGNQIWEFQGGDSFYSSPAIASGNLYADNFDGSFYCLDADTGAMVWSYQTGYKNWASPALVNGMMVIASGDHKVYCFWDLNNTPPLTPPAPDGPTSGTVHVPYNFTATTTDPQGEDISFLFDWGDGSTSSWLGPYPSGSIVTGTHSWTTAGTYNITVKAKDTESAESDWSPVHAIIVTDLPVLKIQNVTGGLLKAKTYVKNIGNATATDIHWAFGTANGTIPSLTPGQEQKISSGVLFGFGKKVLKITATCAGSADSRDQDVFLILIFVLIH